MTLVIAIDGPSGSGKSSAARGTALALGLRYLDTGATYRAVTWWLLEHNVDVTDADAVIARALCLSIDLSNDPAHQHVRVDGIDVTSQIRERRVSNEVSLVAAIPGIRRFLVGLQQSIISSAIADGVGIVAEGRDVGTVVAPDADVKVFLTASEQARAERRAAELSAALLTARLADLAELAGHADAGLGGPYTADVTRIEQARRDQRDAPQTQVAADAVEIDATELSLEDVVGRIVDLVAAKRASA